MRALKFQRQIQGLQQSRARLNCGQGIAISGCRSSHLPRDRFFEFGVGKSPRFAMGILTVSHSFRYINIPGLDNHFRLSVTVSPGQILQARCARPQQNKLTTRQTTSGAPIAHLTVASCAPFIFRKSYKTAPPNSKQIFRSAKMKLGLFYYTKRAPQGLVMFLYL